MLSDHAEFFHQVPDEYLADALPVAKKIAAASNLKQYNVLQVSSLSLFLDAFYSHNPMMFLFSRCTEQWKACKPGMSINACIYLYMCLTLCYPAGCAARPFPRYP